jgi:hypothetical protein
MRTREVEAFASRCDHLTQVSSRRGVAEGEQAERGTGPVIGTHRARSTRDRDAALSRTLTPANAVVPIRTLRRAVSPPTAPATTLATVAQPIAPTALAARSPEGSTPRFEPPHAAAPHGAPSASAV